MKLEDAVRHFGTQRSVAAALGLDESAISRWKNGDGLVPIKHAMTLHNVSGGDLDVVLADYRE